LKLVALDISNQRFCDETCETMLTLLMQQSSAPVSERGMACGVTSLRARANNIGPRTAKLLTAGLSDGRLGRLTDIDVALNRPLSRASDATRALVEAACKASCLQHIAVTLAADEVAGPVSTALVNNLHAQQRTVDGEGGAAGGRPKRGGGGKKTKGVRGGAASKLRSGGGTEQGLQSLAVVHSPSLSTPFWFSLGTIVASLVHIDLSSNLLGLHGALALARALARRCRARQPGASESDARVDFSAATRIVTLNVSRNGIGCVGAAAIADSLLGCASLTRLDLSTNDIGPEMGHGANIGAPEHCADRLRALLAQCDALVSVDLSGNELPDEWWLSSAAASPRSGRGEDRRVACVNGVLTRCAATARARGGARLGAHEAREAEKEAEGGGDFELETGEWADTVRAEMY
jgi:hypothetical protein